MKWVQHGAWNTLENGVTRLCDLMITVILLRMLPTETFSGLAFASAAAAPLLVLFVSPPLVLYRYYADWKMAGATELARRLAVLRAFGRGLGVLALGLSLIAALVFPSSLGLYDRFFAYLWAFSLLTGAHIAGGDREFLRLELRWLALNGIVLLQKALVLFAALAVGYMAPGRIDLLALTALGSMIVSSALAYAQTRAILRDSGAVFGPGIGVGGTWSMIKGFMLDFSLWNHLTGVVLNWTQSMDVFFLGLFQVPALTLGLYSVALKIANASLAIPNSVANFYSVWVGRRPSPSLNEGREVIKLAILLALTTAALSAVLIYYLPPIVDWLSRGRWNEESQAQVIHWTKFLLAGVVIYSAALLPNAWLMLRGKVRLVFWRISFPWLLGAIVIYVSAVSNGGAEWAAMANLPAYGILVVLIAFWRLSKQTST